MLSLYNSLLGSNIDDNNDKVCDESFAPSNISDNAISSLNSSTSSFATASPASPASPDKDSSGTFGKSANQVSTADLDDVETRKQILVFLLQESSDHKKEIANLKSENQVLRESNDDLCEKTLKIIRFVRHLKKSLDTTNENIAALQTRNGEILDDLSNSVNDLKGQIRDLEQRSFTAQSAEYSSSCNSSRDCSGSFGESKEREENSVSVSEDVAAVNTPGPDPTLIARFAEFEHNLQDLQAKSTLNKKSIASLESAQKETISHINILKEESIRLDTNIIATNQYN